MNTFYESRIKNYLRSALDQYLDTIDREAEKYAKELNLNLEILKDNFVELFHIKIPLFERNKPIIELISKNAEIKMSGLNI